MSAQDPGDDERPPAGDEGRSTPRPESWSVLRIVLTVILGIPLVLIALALLVLGACFLSLR